MNVLQFSAKPNTRRSQTAMSLHGFATWSLSALLLLILFIGCPAWAVDVSVYGPVQFTRSTGAPVQVQKTVIVTNPTAAYRLHIVNGGLQNSSQTGIYVSSALIYWNGSLIARPADFNPHTSTLTLPVTAQLSTTR